MIFDALLGWVKTYALVIAGVVALAGWGSVALQTYRLAAARTDLANEQASRAAERLEASEQALLDSEKYRLRERAWREASERLVKEAHVQAERERADRLIADAAAGRLQQRLDFYVAAARRAAQTASTSKGSQATEGSLGVLADMLGRCIQRVRLLGEVADARGNAGTTCERISDEVRAAQE